MGFFRRAFGGPEGFFAEHFVVNYCPLVFMEDSARNRTPDKLPAAETEPLFAACDRRLVQPGRSLSARMGRRSGGFARKKLDALFGPKAPRGDLVHVPANIGTVLHPSPASPAANRGWAERRKSQTERTGISGNRNRNRYGLICITNL